MLTSVSVANAWPRGRVWGWYIRWRRHRGRVAQPRTGRGTAARSRVAGAYPFCFPVFVLVYAFSSSRFTLLPFLLPLFGRPPFCFGLCIVLYCLIFCALGVSEKGRPWRVVFMVVVGFFFVRFFLKLVTINFLVSLIASSPTRTIFPSDHQDQLVPPCRGPCRAQDVRRCLVVVGG